MLEGHSPEAVCGYRGVGLHGLERSVRGGGGRGNPFFQPGSAAVEVGFASQIPAEGFGSGPHDQGRAGPVPGPRGKDLHLDGTADLQDHVPYRVPAWGSPGHEGAQLGPPGNDLPGDRELQGQALRNAQKREDAPGGPSVLPGGGVGVLPGPSSERSVEGREGQGGGPFIPGPQGKRVLAIQPTESPVHHEKGLPERGASGS